MPAVGILIGVAAVGWVASPVVTKLLNEGFTNLGINTKERLERLEITILPVFKSVIEKAEGSEHLSKVIKWLQRLKDAHDDAEDALDLLNYRRLERQVIKAARRIRVRSLFRSHPLPRPVKSVIKGGRDMLSPRKMKLRRRLNKLEKIACEAEKLRALLGVQPETAPPPDRQTISQPPRKVFGRDEDCREIVRLLKMERPAVREPGSAGIPIIAIVGRPGVGKTTLAQYVYEQLRSEGEQHFHLVMWVYASCNFKLDEIMKNIIQQASRAAELPITDAAAVSSIDSRQVLQQVMVKNLNSKKFLLVIDDVWCDGDAHVNSWDTLLGCLSKCLPGSKILVTSQTSDAPRKIGATRENIYCLEQLKENEILDLFFHHALPSREIDSCLREDLEEIGKKIAWKLNQDPTAAKLVGLCLRDNLEVRYWRDAEQKDWSGDRTKALMWSYRHLPAHLQRCFSFCSLYPRGYKFEALELVQLWMAQGFVKPSAEQNERMDDAGNRYLNDLASRFYIQHHGSYYTLHELLYDLAERVSSNECLRIEGNHQTTIPSTIRHLRISTNKLNENKEDICKLKKLRTLIVTKGIGITSEENVAVGIFKSLKKLRKLVLELNLENLADFLSEMKHLRVLKILDASEFVLPDSACALYQLQVLRTKSARSLPKCLSNLVRLRHLEADFDIVSAIPDIGRLTSLHGLEKFQVRKEKGYELAQLQKLNELRGTLRICGLENVESKESAAAANLNEKKYLEELQLVCGEGEDNVNSNSDAEILEGLQLPPYLTGLRLQGYRGLSYPSWPGNQTSNIENLALRRCSMLEELPPMDQLYLSCRSLELLDLSRLKAVHALPPKLTEVTIENTPFLTFVTKEELQMSRAQKRSIIEVLRKGMRKRFLHQYKEYLVYNEREMRDFIATMNGSDSEASAPEQTGASADMDITAVWERWLRLHERKTELIYDRQNEAKLVLPSTLTKLWIRRCNITDRALSVCLQNLTSLTILVLTNIKTITCLPSKDVLGQLKALQSISLTACWALTSLGGIGFLPHVKKLQLSECPCLKRGTAFLPSSLESIVFVCCVDVDDILANADLPHLFHLTITDCDMRTASLRLGNLRSLRSLRISSCANLKEVMDLPRSLTSVLIDKCPILEERSIQIDRLSDRRMLDGIPLEN